MTTYILLRDNKESIPLSITELRNIGLKSTDLIWVEGQSVCWMHPGQIKELKDMGLPTEVKSPELPLINEEVKVEQSFSPVSLTDTIIVETKKPEAAENVVKPDTGKFSQPVKNYVHPKKIFVELPHLEKNQQPAQPVFKENAKKSAAIDDSFPVAETKYSKPLDEIKELYLENLEKQQRRMKTGWQVPPRLKRAAVYLVLFLAGIVAGLLINKSFSHKDAYASVSDPRTASAENIKMDMPQTPADSLAENNIIPVMNQGQAETPATSIHDKIYDEAYKTVTQSKETTQVNSDILPDPAPVEENVVQVKEPEIREVKKPSIKEIYSQVAVKNNDYTVGSFGGIKNLELTVSNHSRFSLDEVEVTVQYLKPGDELIKSETISVRGIGPGASKTIPVKRTNRGVKVVSKVSSIESKDFMNSTAGL